MATSPLFGWEEPDDTDLVKDGAAAIRTLGNAIDTSMGDLLGGTSGQVLSKNSNTNMDFTWVTSDDANAIQNAIVDAKGDLITATAADTPARLAVGTNGQTLVADSTASTGLKWATPATVSSGLTLINRSTFSNVASHTIDSVFSSTYNSYLVSIEYVYAATSTDAIGLRYRYGGSTESGSSYYYNNINATYSSGTVTNTQGGGVTSIVLSTKGGDSGGPISGFLDFNRIGTSSQIPITTGRLSNAKEVTIHNIGGETVTTQTYTGFVLFAASNITGAVSVYGLAI
jgi:hypothetical protein